MAKALTHCYLFVWLLISVCSTNAVAAPATTDSAIAAKRAALAKVFGAEVGVQEVGCSNCGPRVETYLKASGNHRGQPWCGAFVTWCMKQVGLAVPAGPGAARNWFPAKRIIYSRGRATRGPPETGDLVGYYYNNLGRIGHIGFVERWGDDFVVTVEGNTGGGGINRNGGAVRRMRRLRSQITVVASWI